MSTLKKHWLKIVLGGVVLVVVGGIGAWIYGNQLVASDPFTLEEVTQNDTEAAGEVKPEPVIADESEAVDTEAVETTSEPEAIDLSEGFGLINFAGANGFGKANGTFHDWVFTRVQIDRDALEESVVEIEVDLNSLDTRNTRRDNHLKSDDFFDVANFPTATLKFYNFTAVEVDESNMGTYTAQFEFTLHGVTNAYEIQLNVTHADLLQVEGRLDINRLDFGVGQPHSSFNPTVPQNEIEITFSATVPARL